MTKELPNTQAPAGLKNFQRDFARFLRDPHHIKRPKGIPKRAGDVYQGLLFNNVREFLDTCFPICQTMISKERWQRLCRVYFRDWQSDSPIFNHIPAEFVQFLEKAAHNQPLPQWFTELAHYEWIELAVDVHPANLNDYVTIHHDANLAGANVSEVMIQSLHNHTLTLNPTAQNLYYQFPVHKLSPSFKTRKREDTYVVVYRDAEHDVRFMHINAMTSYLLSFIAEKEAQATPPDINLLTEFGTFIGYSDIAQLQTFGLQLLTDLLNKEVLVVKK